MIDEIDYFPRRDQHNKKKKKDTSWSDLKKQKSEQDTKVPNKKPTRRRVTPGSNEQ